MCLDTGSQTCVYVYMLLFTKSADYYSVPLLVPTGGRDTGRYRGPHVREVLCCLKTTGDPL
jgi:hypothetical protein